MLNFVNNYGSVAALETRTAKRKNSNFFSLSVYHGWSLRLTN